MNGKPPTPLRRVQFGLLGLLLFAFFVQVAISLSQLLWRSSVALLFILPTVGGAFGASVGSLSKDSDSILAGCLWGALAGLVLGILMLAKP